MNNKKEKSTLEAATPKGALSQIDEQNLSTKVYHKKVNYKRLNLVSQYIIGLLFTTLMYSTLNKSVPKNEQIAGYIIMPFLVMYVLHCLTQLFVSWVKGDYINE